MEKQFDLVIIGAGPGGYVSAIRAAQEGMRVAIVENRHVGGTCLNRGCIPTKTLMHASQLYRQLTHGEMLGICAKEATFDVQQMYKRKDEVVGQLRSGVEGLLKANKVELFRGRAQIVANQRVMVDEEEIFASNILIASGSVPARPPIQGLDLSGVITSDELLEQTGTDYKKLIIIGGGVIGVEFATVFSALGCEVTLIEALDRILPTMDREISQNLSMILKKRGVSIYSASAVERIEQTEHGLCCVFNSKGKENRAEAEAVLVSIGRRANIDGLFAEGVSVEFDRGIVVDDQFQTSLPGVYAVGDVIAGGIQLAHVASAQGCNAIASLSGNPPEMDLSVIPSCIYTDPEIASVGLTEAQAKERGIAVKTGKFSMAGNGKSIIEAQERGFIKLVFDAESEVLLGAHLMCARATDLIGELAAAIVNKRNVHQISSVVRPHPTFSEGITEAAENVFGKSIHIMPNKREETK